MGSVWIITATMLKSAGERVISLPPKGLATSDKLGAITPQKGNGWPHDADNR